MSALSMRVVVIGAGVVGSSIAAALAERGATVTLADENAPGEGTSGTSFAWANSNGKEPEDYFEINRAGLEAHRRLAQSGGNWLGKGGHVEIAVTPSHRDRLRARIDRLESRAYPVEVLTVARATEMLPDVRVPADAKLIAHFPRESFVYPALYIADALGRARAAGARILTGNAVIGLEQTADAGATVVFADGTVERADTVVSAVGRWTAAVAAMAGADVPMRSYTSPGDETVGYLVETEPLSIRLDNIVTSPELNFRPAGGGRLLLQALDLDATADPAAIPATDSPLAKEFMRRLRNVVIGAEFARPGKVMVGQRAMPGDGRTIAGRTAEASWFYVVATHSGITLAPFLGDAVADEILGDERFELAGFRPTRFKAGNPYELGAVPRHPGEQ